MRNTDSDGCFGVSPIVTRRVDSAVATNHVDLAFYDVRLRLRLQLNPAATHLALRLGCRHHHDLDIGSIVHLPGPVFPKPETNCRLPELRIGQPLLPARG